MGFIYALIHLFTPIYYKITESLEKSIYVMLLPGGMFQVHFSVLTGGFFTPVLMWVAILPVIAGVVTNKLHTFIWFVIIFITSIIIAYLDISQGMFEINYLHENGKFLTQFLTGFGIMLLHSGFIIFLLNLRDLSEEQLRKKVLSKQNLLRVLAHDVSNPLTIIRNNMSFLNKQALVSDLDQIHPKFKRKLSLTLKSSNTISDLIHAVREIEAFDSGKKDLQLFEISLKDCIEESLEILSSMISVKRIHMRVVIEDEEVWGIKSVIIHQVICNILSNCIKFSAEKSDILVHTKVVENQVHLIIKDHGIGIPTALLKKIFDPLATTTREGTEGEKGTGFGMPIAKRSIEMIGGNIHVTSRTLKEHKEDHGTIFKITFQKVAEEIKSIV